MEWGKKQESSIKLEYWSLIFTQKSGQGKRGHYKIFCVNVKYGIQYGFRIFYLIALQNEENYEREESCSAWWGIK